MKRAMLFAVLAVAACANLPATTYYLSPDGDDGLTAASPCKDAGQAESWMADATDLVGAPRIFGAAPDMGCYERIYPLGATIIFR